MRLGDHLDILSGFAFKSKQFNTEGKGLPVVRIRDVGKESSETYYEGEYKEDYILNDGDLLIGMDGDFRLAEWKGGRALLNQRVCKITVSSNDLYRNYLLRMLPRELKRIEDTTSFATVKHLSVKKINGIDFPLPPLEEQKKIAAILDAADDYRQKTKALINKYDQLTQSLFLDMFGDPFTNPKGWTIKQIKEVAKVLNGTTPKTSDSRYWNGDYSWVTPAEIKSKYLNKTDRHLTREGVLSKSLKMIEKNNVLLTSRAPIGKVSINKIDTFTNQGFKSMVIDRNLINVQYLYQILVLSESRLNQLGRGATFKEISKSIVEEFELPIPNLTLQNQFAERVAEIEKQKQQAEASLVKAEELFSSLLQRAFKGELIS
jgi:type I restriction enzyme, S subunit